MWYEKYVGIPFEMNKSSTQSCDCAGLLFIVVNQELGVPVVRTDNATFNAKDKYGIFLQFSKIMTPVDITRIQALDIFVQFGQPWHAGIVVDSDTILDTTIEKGSSLRSIANILHRDTKFYRIGGV